MGRGSSDTAGAAESVTEEKAGVRRGGVASGRSADPERGEGPRRMAVPAAQENDGGFRPRS